MRYIISLMALLLCISGHAAYAAPEAPLSFTKSDMSSYIWSENTAAEENISTVNTLGFNWPSPFTVKVVEFTATGVVTILLVVGGVWMLLPEQIEIALTLGAEGSAILPEEALVDVSADVVSSGGRIAEEIVAGGGSLSPLLNVAEDVRAVAALQASVAAAIEAGSEQTIIENLEEAAAESLENLEKKYFPISYWSGIIFGFG